jgi:hypothetical protein
MTLNALPDPRSQIDSLERALYEKVKRIADLEEELRQEKLKSNGVEVGAAHLRATLGPLYQALQMVFEHIDAMGVRDYAPPASAAKQAVWESWKQKLGGLTAKAIDVLSLHGPMNQTQLRIQLACASRSVTNIVAALNKAGLINKVDGGKIALKEL